MEVVTEYLGDTAFRVMARGHDLICDQPCENGGSDSGMSPPEFLLAALATCAGYYATQYLLTRKLPAENVKVRVRAEKGQHPARLAAFQIEVTVPRLAENYEAAVLRAVRTCLIHNTLLERPEIEITVNASAVAHA
jgi:putative redox protein